MSKQITLNVPFWPLTLLIGLALMIGTAVVAHRTGQAGGLLQRITLPPELQAPVAIVDANELAPRRGKVYVRWRTGGGLCNQLDGHVNGLALALALGADAVVLPPTWYRNTFNSTRGEASIVNGVDAANSMHAQVYVQ